MIIYFLINLIFAESFLTAQTNEYPDLLSRAKFPPPIEESNSEIPIGHKQPIGWQRAPESPVQEYAEVIDTVSFWKNHVKPRVPLVYRGVIKDSPAISLWKNDDYIAEHYGDLDVLVEHKREDRTSSSGRMVLKDFLKNYKKDDLYIVTMFPTEMMHQVKVEIC